MIVRSVIVRSVIVRSVIVRSVIVRSVIVRSVDDPAPRKSPRRVMQARWQSVLQPTVQHQHTPAAQLVQAFLREARGCGVVTVDASFEDFQNGKMQGGGRQRLCREGCGGGGRGGRGPGGSRCIVKGRGEEGGDDAVSDSCAGV